MIKLDFERYVKLPDLARRLSGVFNQIISMFTDIDNRVTNIENGINDLGSEAVGSIKEWPVESSIPVGWFLLNGQAISRTTYSQLFDLIGTNYGPGDGSTTFNLENREGLVPRGIGSQSVNGNTKVGPTNIGDKQEDQFQGHLVSSRGITTAGAGAGSPANTFRNIGRDNSAPAFTINSTLISDGTNGTPRVGAETMVSSFGTIWIIKAANTSNTTTTQAEVDVLNADLQFLGAKQNKEKYISCIATQRQTNTSATAQFVGSSDITGATAGSINRRTLNNFELSSGSEDYFSAVNFAAAGSYIRLHRPGVYKITATVTFRQCNAGSATVNIGNPSTGITRQIRCADTRTATGSSSVGNVTSVTWTATYRLLPSYQPDINAIGVSLWQQLETITGVSGYGLFWILGTNDAPENTCDTCSLEIELIRDL